MLQGRFHLVNLIVFVVKFALLTLVLIYYYSLLKFYIYFLVKMEYISVSILRCE